MTDKFSAAAILKVDGGRGFVVQGRRGRLVITAGHCLQRGGEPYIAPCHGASRIDERTYPNLLGPLGGECTISTECLFVDPIADIAVLGPPDGQELYEEAEAYEALVEEVEPLPIGEPAWKEGEVYEIPGGERHVLFNHAPAWLLSLDGRWLRCTVRRNRVMLWIEDGAEQIESGMSGSPILADDGSAIGVVCLSKGANPYLADNLPGWLSQSMGLFGR
jgi:Trypsin-like peptidase domain